MADDPQTLAHRYATAVDTRSFADLAEVFTPDAVLETGRGVRDGLDAIVEAMQGLHRYDTTDHRVGATSLTVDGDDATGTVECVAHHWWNEDDTRWDRVMEITYHDRLQRTTAGWRIVHRRLEIHRLDDVVAD